MTRPHIEALTSLRFFAALLVLFFHHGQAQFTGAPIWIQNVLRGGYVGVPFFFILSGFILTYNYAPRAPGLDRRGFWIARLARVYPVYAFSLIFSAPLFFAALAESASPHSLPARVAVQFAATFGLVQSWNPHWAFAWNGPGWSLSVEAFFYLIFPWLLNHLTRTGRVLALVGMGLISAAGLVAAKLFLGGNVLALLQNTLGWANPLLWLPLFLLGIALGDRYLARPTAPASSRRRAFLPAGGVSALLVAVIVGILAANLQRFSQLLFCYLVAIPCAWLIYHTAAEDSWFRTLLARRSLVLLGEASYSLYILHRPIHDWFRWMNERWGLASTQTLPGFVLYAGACIAFSLLTLKIIEYPCRDWIKRRFSPRPAFSAAPPLSAQPPSECPVTS